MKFVTFLLLILINGTVEAGAAEHIPMPQARFNTGDDSAWSHPDFDDREWKVIKTTANYEGQGFDGYDGYSWYRIHVVIPSSLKRTSQWKERLRVFLAAIDDADETFLNGVKIGQTGRMPGDPRGYEGQYQTMRDYLVDPRGDVVRWDRDNVIAVRVYDDGGGGGFHKGTPFIGMAERVDGVRLDATRSVYHFLPGNRVTVGVNVANAYPIIQKGTLEHTVKDAASGRALSRYSQPLTIEPQGSATVKFTAAARPGIQVSYRYIDGYSGKHVDATHVLPYLLTPPDSAIPAIHGARVFGARPKMPLLVRIAATGRAPLRYGTVNLPAGLALDAATGVISGLAPGKGIYKIQLNAGNGLGEAVSELSLVVGDTLALTPPMGWNSWYAYGASVSDAQIRQAAEALVDKGLAAHGWNYVNIDDGWESEKRGADGAISGNAKFPDMRALGDFLHARGLKFGIYSSPGPLTCGRFLGSLDHERQDALTYADWGVDYLKYDLCSYAAENTLASHQKPYRLMGEVLRDLPRDMVYSLCQYGRQDVWKWGGAVRGNVWRTTDDIEDKWESVVSIGFRQAQYSAFAGPGRWNDPDMLQVGNLGMGGPLHPSRLTPDEQYSQASLWSLLPAPLLISNDLPSLDAFTLNLLTNDEVLAINQDSLGNAARRVFQDNDWQIWVKELEHGRKAVGVFNLGAKFRSLKLTADQIGLSGSFKARDAWRQKDLGRFSSDIAVSVPSHGVALLVVDR